MIKNNTEKLVAEILRDAADNDGLKSVKVSGEGVLALLIVRYHNNFGNTYLPAGGIIGADAKEARKLLKPHITK